MKPSFAPAGKEPFERRQRRANQGALDDFCTGIGAFNDARLILSTSGPFRALGYLAAKTDARILGAANDDYLSDQFRDLSSRFAGVGTSFPDPVL